MKTINKSLLVVALITSLILGFSGSLTVSAAGPAVVNLLTAGDFTILAKTAITTTGVTLITGDIGISPAFSTNTSGFSLVLDGSGTFSTSSLVIGRVYAANYTAPTPTNVGTAVSAMEAAYTDANSRPTSVLNAGALACAGTCRDLVGTSLVAGVYTFDGAGNVNISGDMTLTGASGDVWIFQIPGNLAISANMKVLLSGGAQSSNIFWAVAGTTTLEPGSTFEGTILAGPGASTIAMQSGAILHGRALGQTDVTLIANTISTPAAVVAQQFLGKPKRDGAINVVKTVINDNGGTKTVADFPLFVNGTRVTSGVTNRFPAPAARYDVTETYNAAKYTRSFSGDCDSNGGININPGDTKFCIVTNNDIGPSVVLPPVPPLIDVVKVPNPLALPNGPGVVAYTYTLTNIGIVPVSDITMVGDTCSPIVLSSGDSNANTKLDLNEIWVYRCSTTLTETHTNTVVTTGWANGVSAVDIANATVVVGVPVVPSLIHLTEVPSPLALLAGGGMVTYTRKVTNLGPVALSNIYITNDVCTARYVSGDANGDAKLDPSETWIYTCQINLTKTTTDTAVVSGTANGLTVRDFAVATVVVGSAAPGLPNTGFMQDDSWYVVTLFSLLMVALTSLVVVLKQRTI